MPAYDGTGPQGLGPLTGRRMGRCRGRVGQQERIGKGFNRSMVQCCNRTDQEPTKQDLEIYRNNLKKKLEEVEKEIGVFDKKQE